MNSQYALGLPKGSVRALLTFTVVGVWASLEVITTGAAPNEVRAMAAGALAGYGILRAKQPEV